MAFTITDNASAEATLARFYEIGLGAEIDPNGLAYWAGQLGAGASLGDIAARFAATRPFNDRFDADLDEVEFVSALYREALGREGEPGGITYWAGQLEAGASRADLLATFAGSGEAQALRDVTAGGGLEVPDFEQPTFRFGVASGDPDASSVVLWTHVTTPADGPVEVAYEVATDADFSDIVASGTTIAGPDTDYTAKAIAGGLEAGGEYFYRFTHDGESSMTGQTRTLPEGALDEVELAVFSCANFPAGYFNPYAEAVERGFDYSVHLGDYIYESAFGGFGSENAEEVGRVPQPLNETVTPQDYSLRYQTYTRDADL